MTDYDEDPRIYNGHYEVQFLIDRPAALIWEPFIHTASWVKSHDIEYVSGSPGAVGSITRVAFKQAAELNMPQPHYHFCKITKAIPGKIFVLKTYSALGGSYGWNITAFDDTRFAELDEGTTISFNLYIELRSEQVLRNRDALDLVMERSREGMITNLTNLKHLVERDTAR